jgi:anthranilate synthase component 1
MARRKVYRAVAPPPVASPVSTRSTPAIPVLAVEPPRDAFLVRYRTGVPQLVATRLVADLETPVSAYLKLTAADARLSFLLESVEGGAVRGRYSMIGLAPDLVWRAHGDVAEVNATPATRPDAFTPDGLGTLASLRALLARSAISIPPGLPPMAAGVFGYMGYDTVRLVERLPGGLPDDLGVPDGVLMRPTVMVVFDAVKDEMIVVTPARPTAETAAEDAYAAACDRLQDTVAKLAAPVPATATTPPADMAAVALGDPVSNTTPATFMDMVGRAKAYIAAGDIFQVVLSQRFSAPFPLPPLALYRALRRTNPSPFLYHLDLGGFQLAGSSPEILVRVRDGRLTIRPIAGTAPRGRDAAEDEARAAALLADPKERAEHLMLLDLGRNDVGRVAVPGTVEVTEQFVVERYSHVMHIVSNVTGRLDPAYDAVDALLAGFPAGTVSGAPKVRAMEIIDELERSKRGPYAGCVGYFSAGGDMDTAIVLRTALLKDGVVHVQSGAGIVYDSRPESEQQECIDKAKAVVRAAETAVSIARGHAVTARGTGNGGPFA